MSEPINPPQTIPSYHLSRLAREARAVLMAHYLLRAAIYVATLIEDCTRYFEKLVRRVAHELYLRSAARTLQQFDERTLADIGLRPAEIEHAVRNGRLATRKIVPKRMRSQRRQAA